MTDALAEPVSSKAFRDFVQFLGWKPVNDFQTEKFFVFANSAAPRRQLRLPISETAPDYNDALNIALTKLAELNNLSPETLLARIRRATEDMISYRVIQSQSDAIPFSVALSIMNGAKDLLLAAAHSAIKLQPYHQRLNRAEPLELLRKTNFRHTQTGSFILNVSAPLSAVETDLSDSQDLFDNSPLTRRTTKLIYDSTQRLIDAIETDSIEQTLVENQQQPLLSANFCNALLALQTDDVDSDIEIQIEWAASKPEPVAPKPLRLARRYFPIIESASRNLMPSRMPAAPKVYIGTVERLDGYDVQNGQREGDVILSLFEMEKETIVKAKATLSIEQYAVATKAHNPTQWVIIEGILRDGKQPRRLTDISLFDFVNKTDRK